MILEPKFEQNQSVEAEELYSGDYRPAVVKRAHITYTVVFTDSGKSAERAEDQIRLPRPTEEEAWEKAAMVIGRRGYLRLDYCCMNSSEAEDFDRETRHQVYKILVTAGVKFTDEVKNRVRKLIVLDNNL